MPQVFDRCRYNQINPYLAEQDRDEEVRDIQQTFAIINRIPVISTLVNLVLLGIAAGYSAYDRLFTVPAEPQNASAFKRYLLEVKTGEDYAIGLMPFAGIAVFAVQSIRASHPRPDPRLQGTATSETYENGAEGENCDHIVAAGKGLFHLDGVGHNKPEVAHVEHPMVDEFAGDWSEWVAGFDFHALYALNNFLREAQTKIRSFIDDKIAPVMTARHLANLLYREGPMQEHLTMLAANEFGEPEFNQLREKIDLPELERRLGWMQGAAAPQNEAEASQAQQWIAVYAALRDNDYAAFQEPWTALSAAYQGHRAAPAHAKYLSRPVENAMMAFVRCFKPEHQGLLQQRLSLFEHPDQMDEERFNALRNQFNLADVLRKARRMERNIEGVRDQTWINLFRAFHDGNYAGFREAYDVLAPIYQEYRATPPQNRAALVGIEQEINQFLDLASDVPASDRTASVFAVTQPLPINDGYIFFRNFGDTCLMVLSPADGFDCIELNADGSMNEASVTIHWLKESSAGLDRGNDDDLDSGLHLIGPFPKGAIAFSFTDGVGEFLTEEELSTLVIQHLTQGSETLLAHLKEAIQAHSVNAQGEQSGDVERPMASKQQPVACKNLDLLDPSAHDDVSIGFTYLSSKSGRSPLGQFPA